MGDVLHDAAQEGMQLQQSLNNVGNAMAGVVAGIAEMSPGVLVLGAAIAALTLPLAAMASGLIAAAGGLAAGAIGVGALLAVGIPAAKSMFTALQSLSQATNAYSEASKNLNIGLKASKQDMAQYQAVLKGVDPSLQGAVKLLRNSNVQWQNLSAAQKRSVVALSENNKALKGMSPAMKAALTALLNEKKAYDSLTPAQRKFAASLSGLKSEWHAVQKAAQPVVTLLLNDLAKLAKDVLPNAKGLIQSTGEAIHRLLVRADNFVKTEQFKAWVKKVAQEIPGVIKAVGDFIGKLSTLAGKLMTNKQDVKDLHDTLTTLYNILNDTIKVVNFLDNVFQKITHNPIIGFISRLNGLLSSTGGLAGAAARAIGSLFTAASGVSGLLGGLGKIAGFADGTPGAPPGWAWVGERGPELMKMAGGETVIPHGPSESIARGYANGTPGYAGALGGNQVFEIYLDGKQIHAAVKKRNYRYNGINGSRAPGGGPSGSWVPTRKQRV